MVVTSDENGKIISTREIAEELLGEYYRNIIKEDYMNDEDERVIVVDTLNDRD